MMRDTITNIISDDVDTHVNSVTPWDGTKAADAIIEAEADMIPDLVWDDWDAGITVAKTPFGKYILALNSSYVLTRPNSGSIFRFKTESDAKAAARYHYKTQVKAMLGLEVEHG